MHVSFHHPKNKKAMRNVARWHTAFRFISKKHPDKSALLPHYQSTYENRESLASNHKLSSARVKHPIYKKLSIVSPITSASGNIDRFSRYLCKCEDRGQCLKLHIL